MDENDLKKHINDINKMTHVEMAELWRYAPSGHPYFDNTLPLYNIFKERFAHFGGMTVEVSKEIGWR